MGLILNLAGSAILVFGSFNPFREGPATIERYSDPNHPSTKKEAMLTRCGLLLLVLGFLMQLIALFLDP